MKPQLYALAIGTLMGITLSRIGFASWDEVHRMFLFADLRMFLAFDISMMLIALDAQLLRRMQPGRVRFAARPIHRGTILGGILFGVGWALSGACPSIALVQLGEGQFAAGITLVGMLSGNWLYGAVRERYLHWDTASCIDD